MAYINGKQIMNVVASVENGRLVEIENKIKTLETDVEDLKQSSVTKDYVDGIVTEAGKSIAYITENYATKEYVDGNYVSTTMLGEIVNVLAEEYATKEYVNGLIGEIETALGGI